MKADAFLGIYGSVRFHPYKNQDVSKYDIVLMACKQFTISIFMHNLVFINVVSGRIAPEPSDFNQHSHKSHGILNSNF